MVWYQRELNAHTLNARQHYAGLHTKSHAGHDFKRSLVGQEAWSGREKAAFFAALSRHSRWRPELISADCGKSEHSVRAYIEQLERGQRAVRRRPTDDEDSREVVEVSQAFVDREEGLASELLMLSQPKPRINQGWSWKSDLRGQLSALQCAINAEDSAVAPASVPTIDEDDLAIQALEAIPKLKRSKKEKAQLRHLLNRKRNRTAYRRKMLRSEGWTDERIAEGGGADAVFELEQANKAREKRPGARRKTPAEVAIERADAAAKQMRDCGAVKAVKEKGLDVFDYNTLALLTGERRVEEHIPNGVPADGERNEKGKAVDGGGEGEEEVEDEQEEELDSSSDTKSPPPASQAPAAKVEQTDDRVLSPSVTLPVMQHLYAEMLAYLKPLIYQAIVIAEAQNRQLRSEEPELIASHVLAALRLRDELDYATDSAPSSPASSESSLPSTEPKSPTKSNSPGALSPNARAELQLPTWADFPPPLPPSTPDQSPLAQYTPLTPMSPETPSRPRWAVDNTPQPEFTLLSPDTTTSGPSVVELPSFPISHPEPNYLDEGTDEEDVAIEAALRRYHKSADRAWDRMYTHGLRNAAKPDPFATPTPLPSQSQSRRSSPGPPPGPSSREKDRKQRKKLKRALEKIDRASERAETDWARYSSVRDTLLRRRERRRAQLRRLREGERRRKRRKLRPPEDELDDEVELPAEERETVVDEIVGTTDEEDDGEAEDAGAEDAEADDEDAAEAAAEDEDEDSEGSEGSGGSEGPEGPEDAEDGALDEDDNENDNEKEERLMDVSFESGDEKEDSAGLGEDIADSDGALDEDLPEADGALDEDDSF